MSDERVQPAVDQFVMRGGHLLVFFDPNAEAEISPGDPEDPRTMAADRSSDLPMLFKAWGIQYDPQKALLDRAHAWFSGLSVAALQATDDGGLHWRLVALPPIDQIRSATTSGTDTCRSYMQVCGRHFGDPQSA